MIRVLSLMLVLSLSEREIKVLSILENLSISVGVDKTFHLPNKFILLFSGSF